MNQIFLVGNVVAFLRLARTYHKFIITVHCSSTPVITLISFAIYSCSAASLIFDAVVLERENTVRWLYN